MTSTSQHQVIALGSAALPQQQLARAASDVLKPSALHIRAAWQLPQQSQQHAPNEQQPQSQQQQQQALLADPVGAGAAAAAAAAASVIPPHVAQRFLSVAPQLKLRTLLRLLAAAGSSSSSGGLTLVLANSARAADDVCAALTAGGVSAGVLHAGRSQVQREEALQCFRFGVTQVLVVCGSVYRGLDLPDVSLVVNYEVPLSGAEYARRVGRAGREGRPGSATTLVTPADAGAVGPLVALLRAGAHVVPEWLGALADGSSASAAMEGTEASAAAPAGEASNSSSGGSDAGSDAGSSSLGSRRQQQQQPSALFSSLKQQQQFGGYTRRPKRQAAASPESSPGRD
jgi:superfamily II DNA/RNA helicase